MSFAPAARAGMVAALLPFLLLGCRSLAPPDAHLPEDLEPLVGAEAQAVIAWLDAARTRAHAHARLRASGRLMIDSPQGKGSVRQVVLVDRPARLRLESLNFLGQTQSLLVTDGVEFAFFDGRSVERGPASRNMLFERLGLDLEPEAAAQVLLAAPPLPEDNPLAALGRDDVRVVIFAGQRLQFRRDGDLERYEQLDATGRVRWRVDYARWREVPGGRYPFEAVLWFPASELRAELSLDRVELDPVLEQSLFMLPASPSR